MKVADQPTLKQEDNPELPRQTQCDRRVLINERGGRRVRGYGNSGSRGQNDVTAGFEDEGRPQAKECGHTLEAGKGRGINSALEPPEGMQAC